MVNDENKNVKTNKKERIISNHSAQILELVAQSVIILRRFVDSSEETLAGRIRRAAAAGYHKWVG